MQIEVHHDSSSLSRSIRNITVSYQSYTKVLYGNKGHGHGHSARSPPYSRRTVCQRLTPLPRQGSRLTIPVPALTQQTFVARELLRSRKGVVARFGDSGKRGAQSPFELVLVNHRDIRCLFNIAWKRIVYRTSSM